MSGNSATRWLGPRRLKCFPSRPENSQFYLALLGYALEHGKLVIPIVRTELALHPLLARFPRVFTFSPWDNPGAVETQIVEFLKGQQLTKDKQRTIGALAALGLGLIVLFSLNKE